MTQWPIVLTCEHGGHRVPRSLARTFRGAGPALNSHRGWDPGALAIAKSLARDWRCPLVATTVSRLVVDTNRSLHHPHLFSEWTRPLDRATRSAIAVAYWTPHRAAVGDALDAAIRARGWVLHLGIHSFVPQLAGRDRPFELGLLYDPRRSRERAWARGLRAELRTCAPAIRVRLNQPYRGVADGLATAERRRRTDAVYLGIEIEVNQRLSTTATGRAQVTRALRTAMASLALTVVIDGG